MRQSTRELPDVRSMTLLSSLIFHITDIQTDDLARMQWCVQYPFGQLLIRPHTPPHWSCCLRCSINKTSQNKIGWWSRNSYRE
jgi:hypothetical protein